MDGDSGAGDFIARFFFYRLAMVWLGAQIATLFIDLSKLMIKLGKVKP